MKTRGEQTDMYV